MLTTFLLVCVSLTLQSNTIQVSPQFAAIIREQDASEVAQSKREALKQCRKAYPDTELAYLNRN